MDDFNFPDLFNIDWFADSTFLLDKSILACFFNCDIWGGADIPAIYRYLGNVGLFFLTYRFIKGLRFLFFFFPTIFFIRGRRGHFSTTAIAQLFVLTQWSFNLDFLLRFYLLLRYKLFERLSFFQIFVFWNQWQIVDLQI